MSEVLLFAQDQESKALKVITNDHADIHANISFAVANKYTIANGTSAYLELKTPVAGYVNLKPIATQSDGPKILVQLLEAPVFTTGVTPLTPVARKRISPAVSATVIKSNPTAVSAGTGIDLDYIGGGSAAGGSGGSGGDIDSNSEWILARNTTYIVKITNNGPAPADVNVKLFWYEQPY